MIEIWGTSHTFKSSAIIIPNPVNQPRESEKHINGN